VDEPTRGRVADARRAMIKAQDVTRQLQVIAHGETADVEQSSFPRPTIVPMPPTMPALQNPPNEARILILDDEPAICTLVAGALESMGFSVVATIETADAIQACEEAFKAGRPFDLMISDLTLPGEFDGTKVVSRLRAMDPDLKAIISSGYDQDPVMRHYRDHGFAGALFKPFDLGQLTRVVREVLDSGSPARKSA
jgi:CheY-like chemotaxis protein